MYLKIIQQEIKYDSLDEIMFCLRGLYELGLFHRRNKIKFVSGITLATVTQVCTPKYKRDAATVGMSVNLNAPTI